MNHAERYRHLTRVRLKYCSSQEQRPDRESVSLELDGNSFGDVPGFLLALGEAVNGPGGYFGGCLDAMSDCFCGGFGLGRNPTIVIRGQQKARTDLDGMAWDRFEAETFHELSQDGMSEEEFVDLGYLGDGTPDECKRWRVIYELLRSEDDQSINLKMHGYVADDSRNYFDVVCEIFQKRGVRLVLKD